MASNALIAVLLLLAVFLFVQAAKHVREKCVRASIELLLAIPLLIFGANSTPGLPFIGPLLQHGAYRTTACEVDGPLVAKRFVIDADGNESNSGATRCAVQFAVNNGATKGPNDSEEVTAPDCWSAANDAAESNRNCYSLSTIEFNDSGDLAEPLQPKELAHHLRRLKNELQARYDLRLLQTPTNERARADRPGLYIVAYVHGWRNDARPGNLDLRKLRVLASSAARDLAARCRLEQRYCNTAVVGIFLGWQGAVGIWDSSDAIGVAGKIGPVLNGLTFAQRKLVSDRIGSAVIAQLTRVRADAHVIFDGAAAAAPSNVKILLLGHSLGGNLVLSGVPSGEIKDERLGLPSDLAIIINPATETSKWVSLWRRVNAKVWSATTSPRLIFLVSPQNYFAEPTEKYKKRVRDEAEQRKMKVASGKTIAANEAGPGANLAAANALAQDRQLQADSEYDSVVDTAFRRNQYVSIWPSTGCDYDMSVYGLGHLPLDRSSCSHTEFTHIFTHFVEVNYSQNTVVTPSTYVVAANPSRSCFVEPAFLYCARTRNGEYEKRCGNTLPSPPGGTWDFAALDRKTLGLVRDVSVDVLALKSTPPAGAPAECVTPKDSAAFAPIKLRSSQQINVQIATGQYAGSKGELKEKFSPLWGVRVFPNALIGHSGFWTTPFECMFNKLVLDDPLGNEHPLERNAEIYRRAVSMSEFAKTLRPQCARLYAMP